MYWIITSRDWQRQCELLLFRNSLKYNLFIIVVDISASTEAFVGMVCLIAVRCRSVWAANRNQTDRFDEGFSRGWNVNSNKKRLYFNEFLNSNSLSFSLWAYSKTVWAVCLNCVSIGVNTQDAVCRLTSALFIVIDRMFQLWRGRSYFTRLPEGRGRRWTWKGWDHFMLFIKLFCAVSSSRQKLA